MATIVNEGLNPTTNKAFYECPHCHQPFMNMSALQIHCLLMSDPVHRVITHGANAVSEPEIVSNPTDLSDNTVVSCVKCRRIIPRSAAVLLNHRFECLSYVSCNSYREEQLPILSTAMVHVPRRLTPTLTETETIRQELRESCSTRTATTN